MRRNAPSLLLRAVVVLVVVLSGLAVAPGPASADTSIDTTSGLTDFFGKLGNSGASVPAPIASMGQVVTAPPGETRLRSFAFQVRLPSTVVFRAEAYAWDGTKVTGPNLYESAPRSTSTVDDTTPELVEFTANVPVTPGQQYVIFISTSKDWSAGTGWGSVSYGSDSLYAGGSFVYQFTGDDPNAWATQSWITGTSNDMGFKATFDAPASAPVFSSATAAAAGSVGQPFSYVPSVTGDVPMTFTVAPDTSFPDALPAGLTLDPLFGFIVGTPADATVGTFKVRLRAHNVGGDDFQQITISIAKGTISGLTASISGPAQQGRTLTAVAGPVVPADVQLSYQWFANGSSIAGATGPTYKVAKAVVGKQITVTITATRTGYQQATDQSDPTVPVHAKYSRAEVQLSKTSAKRGQTVSVNGFGFHPGNTYTVRYNASIFGTGGTTIATLTADEYGELSVPLTIPNSSPSGPVTVTVTGSDPALVISTITVTNG